jgi:hypothetical protein
MTINRREFLVGTAVMALAPTLKLLPSLRTSNATELNPVTFMIDVWSSQDHSETANLVWMRIGHSWRTNWR